MKCPRCKEEYGGFPATSRRDNKTKICPDCGTDEAIFDFKYNRVVGNVEVMEDWEKIKQKERSWLK